MHTQVAQASTAWGLWVSRPGQTLANQISESFNTGPSDPHDSWAVVHAVCLPSEAQRTSRTPLYAPLITLVARSSSPSSPVLPHPPHPSHTSTHDCVPESRRCSRPSPQYYRHRQVQSAAALASRCIAAQRWPARTRRPLRFDRGSNGAVAVRGCTASTGCLSRRAPESNARGKQRLRSMNLRCQ